MQHPHPQVDAAATSRASQPRVAGGGSQDDPAPPFADSLCAEMRALGRQIAKVAATPAAVLIIGESGTGKDVIARLLHERSARARGPFVPVNCGAIAPALIETQLFGHEPGSYTGATGRRAGYFEAAHGGTLFLDEVTEMPLDMQVKLLRVLENGSYARVGGTELLHTDARVIAATNRDPQVAVASGRLREDLLYRLAVVPLQVPPLRRRGQDVLRLAHLFLAEFNAREGMEKTFSRRSLEAIAAYDWPGNVRELRNAVHRAHILSGAVVEIGPLARPAPPQGAAGASDEAAAPHAGASGPSLTMGVGTPLQQAQRAFIAATLDMYQGDKRRAARTLGISLKTLRNRMDARREQAHTVRAP